METPTTRLCDACGLPPRLAADGETLISLRKCSRCHQRWYHDTDCQRRDFGSHKRECRRIHKNMTSTQPPLYRVEERPNKGRCVVACQAISAGQSVDSFPPMVPPVLLETQRSSRCALCFATLTSSSILEFYDTPHVPQYPLYLCSTNCRKRGHDFHLQQEEELVVRLCRSNPRVQVLSTAILLYRILYSIAQQEATMVNQEHDCLLRNQVESLQSHHDCTTTTADEEHHHTRAVLFLTKSLIDLQSQKQDTLQSILQSFSSPYMKQVLSRIKTNGFSICNGESVAIGVGLFAQASNMNHSCRPNALQTFHYGNCGKLPLLQVTACCAIPQGDEICISYMDNTCPRHLRKKRLEKTYHFDCTCEACRDNDYNDALVGIKCSGGCDGNVWQQTDESDDSSCWWQCDACGNTDFTAANDLMRVMDAREEREQPTTIQEQERLYTLAKANFKAKSWYVAECGEQLAQSLLDAIDSADDGEIQRSCAKALAIFDELLLADRSGTPWNVLKRQVLLCKRAKLRLYLVPDPSMAVAELQSVLDTLSIYYPTDHEFVQEIRNTMAQGFS